MSLKRRDYWTGKEVSRHARGRSLVRMPKPEDPEILRLQAQLKKSERPLSDFMQEGK